MNNAAADLAATAREKLEGAGHDGAIYKNEVEGGTGYIAFDPKQIKSAIGNRGTFDPKNPNILFQSAGASFVLCRLRNRHCAFVAIVDGEYGNRRPIVRPELVSE